MAESKIQGISFPFRLGVKGGVVTSYANSTSVQHIVESMQQILLTNKFERCMEYHMYSEVDSQIYQTNNAATQRMVSYLTKEALSRLETRVTINDVKVVSEEGVLLAAVNFTVKSTDSTYETLLEVGALNGKNSNS